jgi:hypothetical protein
MQEMKVKHEKNWGLSINPAAFTNRFTDFIDIKLIHINPSQSYDLQIWAEQRTDSCFAIHMNKPTRHSYRTVCSVPRNRTMKQQIWSTQLAYDACSINYYSDISLPLPVIFRLSNHHIKYKTTIPFNMVNSRHLNLTFSMVHVSYRFQYSQQLSNMWQYTYLTVFNTASNI